MIYGVDVLSKQQFSNYKLTLNPPVLPIKTIGVNPKPGIIYRFFNVVVVS